MAGYLSQVEVVSASRSVSALAAIKRWPAWPRSRSSVTGAGMGIHKRYWDACLGRKASLDRLARALPGRRG